VRREGAQKKSRHKGGTVGLHLELFYSDEDFVVAWGTVA
jgi:hypothetical protein